MRPLSYGYGLFSQSYNPLCFSLKEIQGGRLGQHIHRMECTCLFPDPSDTSGPTQLSAGRVEEVSISLPRQTRLEPGLSESPQNPPITGLADPLDRFVLGTEGIEPRSFLSTRSQMRSMGTYPFEPWDNSALLAT